MSIAKQVLMERFPAIGLQVGAVRPKKEKLPEHALYIDGLRAENYFLYQGWLKEKPHRRLIFIEKDLKKIAAFLEKPYAPQILQDEQVHISQANSEELAYQFPYKSIEVIGRKSLRLELLKKTTYAYFLQLDRLQSDQLFYHFLQNARHLPRSFYANGLKGAFKNVPAIVCGAGPSLKPDRLPADIALIIAGGSTIVALKEIHFALATDPNLEEKRRLENKIPAGTPFIYSTRLQPDVLASCKGPIGYMRTGIGGALEHLIEEALHLTGPEIGDERSSDAMSITSICIAWAHYLGCNPILLDGIDMAYTNKQRYAAGIEAENTLRTDLKLKDRRGKLVDTNISFTMESNAISALAKSYSDTRFINTTEGGLGFKGIDYIPFAEATKDFALQKDLKKRVESAIAASPMPPNTKEIVEGKVQEIGESLGRVIAHLEVLVGEKKGSTALAEVELSEEMARVYLFYDIEIVLRDDSQKYKTWLELARKYQMAFTQR